VSEAPLEVANRLFTQAVAALRAAAGPAASDADLLGVLTVGEGVRRALDRAGVAALADLERRGTFGERGYRSGAAALGDLLGWERLEARRHLAAAEHVRPRVGLDGTLLPSRLPATAAAFETGAAGVRHVEVVARVLGSDAAGRLDPQRWADAEAQLAGWIPECTPTELQARGEQLLEALDADGPEPDDRPEPSVNELYLQRNRGGGGGKLVGRFDDAAMFDAIATLVDAQAAPRTAEDDRTPAQRQAEALADACGWVLAHADTAALSSCGGRRPHMSVVVGLADLERRARAGCLDFGGTLSPAALRMLACDAAVAGSRAGNRAPSRAMRGRT
jgi:5-methylcytosine-specific restriction protein A